ncbi:sugar ABC transporter permease [Niveibacterium umoris]|uniref:Glucose/mannose transport system permease protein n=1 Tax=Niveibacterium umoris TaxID=1193620 RepID=A0A840BEV6_9RHOO|nr:sugar ABC transporter permease [Niveibacterium umoris]MBB4010714.1 glucose/mannose transport system permease protein [Niveibacterium umoris]
MSGETAPVASSPIAGKRAPTSSLYDLIENWLPKIVIAPTFVACLVFVYGYILWTAILSMTPSRMLPTYSFVGFEQYTSLFDNDRWWLALKNLVIFGLLFVIICLVVGLLLAILLDQRIRLEGFIRSIYLYPMALSFIVTGTAWKWVLNPGLGIEKVVRDIGFSDFTFDWLVNPDRAIYTVVIAGVWQSSGFVMALFLAGLRGIDDSIIKAARVDGASMPRIYWRIILPSLRPVFFSCFMILAHIAIKSFDLVVALTGGGPGFSSDVPATFMYTHAFTRNQIGLGAASAMMMLMIIVTVVVPMIWSETRRTSNG